MGRGREQPVGGRLERSRRGVLRRVRDPAHVARASRARAISARPGRTSNANTYDDIKTIAWGRYEKAAYCGMMVYLGDLFPKEWRDTLFFHDIHMNKQRNERVVRSGSGYKSERNGDFMDSGDKWFRGLSPQYGPDGSVFINDWYDKVPCHQQREFTDRTNGRIYKVTTNGVKPVQVDLSKASEAELVQYQLHANDWYVRHARRILQERGLKPEGTAALEKILFENADDTRQLRALWALHCGGTLAEATALKALTAKSEYVRGWAMHARFAKTTSPARRRSPSSRDWRRTTRARSCASASRAPRSASPSPTAGPSSPHSPRMPRMRPTRTSRSCSGMPPSQPSPPTPQRLRNCSRAARFRRCRSSSRAASPPENEAHARSRHRARARSRGGRAGQLEARSARLHARENRRPGSAVEHPQGHARFAARPARHRGAEGLARGVREAQGQPR